MVQGLQRNVDDMRNKPLHYPAGTRPFKSPEDQIEIDELLGCCRNDDFTFSVVISKDTTRREAMHNPHHSLAVFTKQVYLEAAEEAQVHMKANVKKQEWHNCVEAMRADTVKYTDISDVGLENPMRKSLDRGQFLAKSESLSTRVIDQVWTDLQAKENEINVKTAATSGPAHLRLLSLARKYVLGTRPSTCLSPRRLILLGALRPPVKLTVVD